jgi:hypothetical protein
MNSKRRSEATSIIRHSTIVIRHPKGSTFDNRHSFRLPAESSDSSGPTLKADGYRFSLDNDRNFASPF